MPPASPAALMLAKRLRDLRLSQWPGTKVTQAQLAQALSSSKAIGNATVSSWEGNNPKLPPLERIHAIAQFFATPRSLKGDPHLVPESELTKDERASWARLSTELAELLETARKPFEDEPVAVRRSWQFTDSGPVMIVCPDAPPEARGPLAEPSDPNYSELLAIADLDALVELYGHIRAENPAMPVSFKRATHVDADDLSGHVILLGGIGWNKVTRRILDALGSMPIGQIDDPDVTDGEVIVVRGEGRPDRPFNSKFSDDEKNPELIEDVAWLARLQNPFNSNRTLTLCNGIHSRGVLGAVRCLTDPRVRDANENYLAERFPDPSGFAVLMRVPVIQGKSMSPDLSNGEVRLYEWPSAGLPE
jgi:transcriptional regulator with XRE-family HTH domain